MPGRNSDIRVTVKGDADFGAARREAKGALDDIEREAKDVKLSPELDTASIRQAIALAEQLDGMVATLDIDADPADIVAAEKLARSLRGFQARVDLSVEGKAELTEALGLADKMEGLRKVRVEVQGRQDLERAQEIADDLERRRTVPIDAQASDLVRLDDKVAEALSSGGEAGAEGIVGALGDVDLSDVGGSLAEQLSGSLAAAGPYVAAAGTVGALFGESFLEGFNNALPDSRGDTIRALRTNLPERDLREVGQAGGAAYSSGLIVGLADAKDAAALIKSELGDIDKSLDLTEATRQASALAQVFEVDLGESVLAVDKLVSQGLVKNAEEGFNLLFELGQQVGKEQLPELLELTSEFSNALKAVGIEGPKGLKLIGQMVEQGIFPQVDQAGEVFEEFNEQINNGGAAEGLATIGLNAEQMLSRLQAGGPDAAKATAEIARQLLATDDNALQASASAAIFGGNMDLLGDDAREAALRLIASADATAAVGDAASAAADDIEASASGMDRLKKVAVDLGDNLGTTVGSLLDMGNALASADWDSARDKADEFGQTLGTLVGGPLAQFADTIGVDPFGPLKDGFDDLFGKSDDLPPKLASTSDALSKTSGEASGLGTSLAEAADQADELESQLNDLFNFGADQMMRDVAEAGEALAAALEDGAAKAVGFNGEIDITSKAGRDLQVAMEDLNGILVDAAVAFANGEISAEQLGNVQGFVQDQLESSGVSADIAADKVQGLTNKYLDQEGIDSITTDLIANDLASGKIGTIQRALAALPSSKTITISASINGPVGAVGTVTRRARGGWTDGLTLVGEEGPELIDVRGRAFVHTAAETRELRSNRGSLGGGAPAAPVGRTGPAIYIDKWVVDPGRDSWQDLQLAELVYSGGRR